MVLGLVNYTNSATDLWSDLFMNKMSSNYETMAKITHITVK